jgi:hypothetical protein
MERNSCIFYKSFYDSIKELDPKDQVQIYNAIFKYQFDNELVDLKGVCKSIFTLIIPQLEANNKRYENGTKGGRPKTKTKPNENQKETKVKPNENVNENDNVNNNDNIKENIIKEKNFKKPTLKEVEEYCKERNNDIDAQRFIDFYESKNWMIGKNKMKDWKACVRTWERTTNTKDIPSWFDKDIQKSELTSKEQQEIDDLINNF